MATLISFLRHVESWLAPYRAIERQAASVERLRRPCLPFEAAVRHLALLESLTTPGHYHYDLHIVSSEDIPEAERLEAAERLASSRRFRSPIPAPRWQAHKAGLTLAVRERAEARGMSCKRMWRRLVAEAIVVAVQQGKHPLPECYLTIDGRRWKVGGESREVIPWELSAPMYDRWLKNWVARELVADLLPDARDQERRAKERFREQPLDTVPEGSLSLAGLDSLIAQDAAVEDGDYLARFLALASPKQREILIHLDSGANSAEAARRMGTRDDNVRQQLYLLRKKFRRAGG